MTCPTCGGLIRPDLLGYYACPRCRKDGRPMPTPTTKPGATMPNKYRVFTDADRTHEVVADHFSVEDDNVHFILNNDESPTAWFNRRSIVAITQLDGPALAGPNVTVNVAGPSLSEEDVRRIQSAIRTAGEAAERAFGR